MTTGQRIKAARKNAGLTQKELGQRLGVAYQTLAQWENDLRNPKYETLQRIAAALNVDVSWLMNGYTLEQRDQESKDYVKKRFAETNAWKDRLDEIGQDLGKLNDEGQVEAVKRVKELTEIEKYRYKQKPSPFSAGIKVYGDGPAGSFPPFPQTPPPSEVKDTTPPIDAPETPPEGE